MSLMRTPAGRAGPNRMEPHLWKVVQEIMWHTQADGQAGRQAERQTYAGVGADHQHGEVGSVAEQAEDGGLQVLVVAGQVHEGNHLRRVLTDLLCRARITVVHHLHTHTHTHTHTHCRSDFIYVHQCY